MSSKMHRWLPFFKWEKVHYLHPQSTDCIPDKGGDTRIAEDLRRGLQEAVF